MKMGEAIFQVAQGQSNQYSEEEKEKFRAAYDLGEDIMETLIKIRKKLKKARFWADVNDFVEHPIISVHKYKAFVPARARAHDLNSMLYAYKEMTGAWTKPIKSKTNGSTWENDVMWNGFCSKMDVENDIDQMKTRIDNNLWYIYAKQQQMRAWAQITKPEKNYGTIFPPLVPDYPRSDDWLEYLRRTRMNKLLFGKSFY